MEIRKNELYMADLQSAVIENDVVNRVLECNRCGSTEVHNQKFYFVDNNTNKKYTVGDDEIVPLPIKCGNCGSQKGFTAPDDSGVEEAEHIYHEQLSTIKSYLIDDFDIEDMETEPYISKAEKSVYTIEPKSGFDSAGYNHYDGKHDANIQNTWYGSFVNVGNTPHMQKKIPVEELMNIRQNKIIGILRSFQPQTYGSRKVNEECKRKIGFSPECLNKGNRKLSDRHIMNALTSIYFDTKFIKVHGARLSKNWKGRQEIEKKNENIARLIIVIKTGDINAGYTEKEYTVKDNTYDPMDMNKLALEQDINWDSPIIDIEKIYAKSKQIRRWMK